LLDSRFSDSPLNKLFRGAPGSDIRNQGSWGDLISDTDAQMRRDDPNLSGPDASRLSGHASFAWAMNLRLNLNELVRHDNADELPVRQDNAGLGQGTARISLWQAVRGADGLAYETPGMLVLPLYIPTEDDPATVDENEVSVFGGDACEQIINMPAEDEVVVTICDVDNPQYGPCPTIGGTRLSKLDVIIKTGPIADNPVMQGALRTVAHSLFTNEGIVALALPTLAEGGNAALNIEWTLSGEAEHFDNEACNDIAEARHDRADGGNISDPAMQNTPIDMTLGDAAPDAGASDAGSKDPDTEVDGGEGNKDDDAEPEGGGPLDPPPDDRMDIDSGAD
jgi:hypothetical protein